MIPAILSDKPPHLDSSISSTFFSQLKEQITHQNFYAAETLLLSLFAEVASEDEIIQCYDFLFELLPYMTSFGDLENNLSHLLSKSTEMRDYQEKLALYLAQAYLSKGYEVKAMHCFAKALQINRSQENYQAASQVFVEYFLKRKEAILDTFLISSTPSVETISLSFEQIKTLERLGFSKGHLSPFYQKILKRINTIPVDQQEKYKEYRTRALYAPTQSQEVHTLAIKQYWEMLQDLRRSFLDCYDVRKLQCDTTEKIRALFKCFLDDVFALIGVSPCGYDIRAMGSMGREEMCPFSDVEFMILIEDESQKPYFQKLVSVLELQIASLGETQALPFLFTCLVEPNPSGLHIDNSPLQEERLLQKPQKMAEMQRRKNFMPQEIEHTVLKSMSLMRNTPKLYDTYQDCLKTGFSREVIFDFFKSRQRDFRVEWKSHFDRKAVCINIKTQFVEILNHLLSDIALYCGVKVTNTFDIIDVLIDQKIFHEEMEPLLKESISLIYQIRLRLHMEYGKQKEEASCTLTSERIQLTSEEIEGLERCYWLVLCPLYSSISVVTDHIKFGETFQEIHLLQKAFSLQSEQESFIYHLASYLCHTNASLETHLLYFESLSKLSYEKSRDIYVDVLEKKDATHILQAVLHIPNPCGMRVIYRKNQQKMEKGLRAITDPFDTQIPGKASVRITANQFEMPRFLKPEAASAILDGQMLKRMYINSAHSVCKFDYKNYGFHFKQKPCHPLMEYAIHSLVSRVAGEYSPTNTLVRFDVTYKGKQIAYPVLISETIPGENLKITSFKSNPSYTWNLLYAILTRPGDGRLANYVIDEKGNLYCIDNDISFVEPVTKSWGSRTVHFSCAPFCVLPLNTPLDERVLEEFASLDMLAICDAWIEEVIEKEKEYMRLFSEKERECLYKEDPENAFTPTILFREGSLATLNLQFWRLQNSISLALRNNQLFTAGDLLQSLVSIREDSIGAYVYKAYNNTQKTPEKKLQIALSRTVESSLTSIQYHKACLGKVPTFEEINRSRLYSPELARREFFRTSLQANSQYAELKTSRNEIALEVNFEALKEEPQREELILRALEQQTKAQIKKPTILAFYHSTLLDSIALKPFLHKDVKILDLRFCEKVDETTLALIQKECPYLKNLILKDCAKITNITPSLFSSQLELDELEYLEMSACANLTKLFFHAPKLQVLRIPYNPKLLWLDFPSVKLLEIDCRQSDSIQLSDTARKSILLLIEHSQHNLATAPLMIRLERDLERDKVLEQLKASKGDWQILLQDFRGDKEIVLEAAKQNGRALEYAVEELKRDRAFVLAAVNQNGSALMYTVEELKRDREIVLEAVKQNGSALMYAAEELKKDREIVLEAVNQNGSALMYAAEELKRDREIVLKVVKQNGSALMYAAEELKRDREIVLEAVRQNRSALMYAAEELKRDRAFVLEAAKQNGSALMYASAWLKRDREFMLEAVKQNELALIYAAEELKRDREIVLKVVKQNGSALMYAAEELKRDREIVLEAVRQNRSALMYAAEELKRDRAFVLEAAKQNGSALMYASAWLKRDREFMLEAVKQNGSALMYAAEELKRDRAFVLAAVKQSGSAFEYASEEFKNDVEILYAAGRK